MEQLTPIDSKNRIVSLDVLRGFALLGILIVNMIYFNTPIIYYQIVGKFPWDQAIDHWVYYGIQFFAEGKFYTMFSFLFGVGFVIFMERAKEKQRKAGLLFLRRLLILLVFGLVHAFFFWYGDILIMYSVIGVILLAFFHRKPRTLLIWVIIIGASSIIIMGSLIIASIAIAQVESAEYMTQTQQFLAEIHEQIENSYYAYGQGSFVELMQQRISDIRFVFTYSIFVIPMILPMFLLGAYVGKRKLISDVDNSIQLIKKIWIWSLLVGLPMNVLKVYSQSRTSYESISLFDVSAHVGMVLGDPALSIFYITTIIILLQKEAWQKILQPFANVGRMALSNYILQTIICTTLFYSYGLGLYGKVGPAMGVVITIVIFVLQIKISRIWLENYKFGPLEWVWRKLTYGNIGRTDVNGR